MLIFPNITTPDLTAKPDLQVLFKDNNIQFDKIDNNFSNLSANF